jgi:DNA-binding transcriptional LysR family regulator
MFAEEIAVGRLVAPYDVVLEEGYGYYLKFHSEDLADPVVSLFRSWLISRFQGRTPSPSSHASKFASAT